MAGVRLSQEELQGAQEIAPVRLSAADLEGATELDETPDEQAQREAFLKPGGTKVYKNRQQYPAGGQDITGQLARERETIPGAGEDALRAVHVALAGPLNAATLGSYGGLERLAGQAGAPGFEQGARDVETYHAENPTVSQFTDAPGYFVGPAAKLAQGIGAGLGYAARAPGAIGRFLSSRPVTGALGGGLTSGSAAGAQVIAGGGDTGEALREGGRAALIGGALGAGVGVAGSAADKVMASKGAKAREFIEQRGGKVGVTSPGKGQVFDEMVTRGTTDADIGAQAEASAAKGLGMLNTEKKGALRAVGNKINRAADSPEAGTLRDVSDIVAKMESSVYDLDTAPQTRAALKDMLDAVKRHQGQDFNPDVDGYFLTESDLNKLRRGLDRQARTGTSVDEKLGPLKGAANQTREMVGEGPFAEPNAEYATEAKRYQESRKLLGITERPKTPEETQAATTKVKNLITRRGQNTVTAGGQEGRLAEFEAKHPDIAEEFARPELLRKKADLSFRLVPQHGGLIDRTVGAQLGGGGAAAAAAIAAALGHGPAAVASLGGLLALQNAQPIAGRLLYRPAQALSSRHLELGIPRLSLAQERRRRENRR